MKLSVLVASFGQQSQRYLDLCFRSLEAQTYRDFEVIHVSSGEYAPMIPNNDCNFPSTIDHSEERLHFPSAISRAYDLSDPKSEYVLLLNDDCVMSRTCIEKLLYVAERVPSLVNPRSNCDDNSRFYFTETPFMNIQYKIDDMEKLADLAINFDDGYPFTLIKQPMVHFYCTMLSKKLWQDVGGIDTNLRTGYDDRLMSFEAVKKGYVPLIAMHAYALHASGATADEHLSQADRKFNEEYFKQKLGL